MTYYMYCGAGLSAQHMANPGNARYTTRSTISLPGTEECKMEGLTANVSSSDAVKMLQIQACVCPSLPPCQHCYYLIPVK